MNLSGEPPRISIAFHPRLRAELTIERSLGKSSRSSWSGNARCLRLQIAHPDVLFGPVGADGTDRSCAKRRNSSCLSACPRPDRVRAAASYDPASRSAQTRRVAVPHGGTWPPLGSGHRPARTSPKTAARVPCLFLAGEPSRQTGLQRQPSRPPGARLTVFGFVREQVPHDAGTAQGVDDVGNGKCDPRRSCTGIPVSPSNIADRFS